MKNKLRSVLTVYTSTWSFWIVLGVTIVGCVGISYGYRSSSRHFISVTPKPSVWTKTFIQMDWKKWRREHKDDLEIKGGGHERPEIDWSVFNPKAYGVHVQTYRDFWMWDRLAEMPHLEFLDLSRQTATARGVFEQESVERLRQRGMFLNSDLKQLERLPKLKTLMLPMGTFNQQDLTPLKSLPNLTWLDLSNAKLSDGLESVPLSENLETLHIPDFHLLTEPAIKHLNQFPKLQTLIIEKGSQFFRFEVIINRTASQIANSDPIVDYTAQNAKARQRLKSLTHLKTLYVAHDFAYGHNSLKKEIPHVLVLPVKVEQNRIMAGFATSMLLFFVSVSLGTMLVAQFSRPEALLTPNATAPHLIVVGLFYLALVIAGTIVFALLNTHLLTALALSLCATCLVFIIPVMYRFPNFGLIIIAPILLWQVGFLTIPKSIFINQLFEGNLLIFAGVLCVTGLALLVYGISLLRSIHQILVCSGLPVPVLGIADMQKLKTRVAPSSSKSRRRAWFDMTARLDFTGNSVSAELPQNEKQFQIWKLANSVTSKLFFRIMVGYILLIELAVLGGYLYYGGLPIIADGFYSIFGVIIATALLWAVPASCSGYWQRMPMMPAELCLPMSREQLLQNLYRGLFKDIYWFPITLILLISPVLFITSSVMESLLWLAIYSVAAIGATIVGYGVILLGLPFRKSWQVTLFIIGYVATSLLIVYVIILISPSLVGQIALQQSLFVIAGLLMLGIGFAIIRYAKSRWEKLEFATLL